MCVYFLPCVCITCTSILICDLINEKFGIQYDNHPHFKKLKVKDF